MRKHPDVFAPVVLSMIDAGEKKGFLEKALQTVATQLEADLKLREDVKSAATYPVVVAVCEDRNGPQNVGAQQAVTPPAGAEADALPAPADQAAVPAPPETPAPAASATKADGITVRTIAMLKRNLPDRAAIRDTVTKPFRYAENGYSWVVRKFVAE